MPPAFQASAGGVFIEKGEKSQYRGKRKNMFAKNQYFFH